MQYNLDVLFARRSIRSFKEGEKISPEQLKTILMAGMAAPSANNQQPWEFIVVDEREKMLAITEVHPYAGMLKTASLGIIVVANMQKLKSQTPWWIQDCAAATQNILLAATGLGLGCVWVGVYPNEERVKAVHQLFKMPEHVIPISIIPIGVPAEEKPMKNEYQEAMVHRNSW